MAPGLVEPLQAAPASDSVKGLVGPKELFIGGPQDFNKTAEERGTGRQPPATHPEYLPIWDADTKYVRPSLHLCSRLCSRGDLLTSRPRYPPLEPFTHYEHGKDADPKFPDLFRDATSVTELTPSTGSEVRGIQLSALTKEGKDQLALFTAQRKVVGKVFLCRLHPELLMPFC